MRKNYVTMLCLAMMLVACGQQTKQKETTSPTEILCSYDTYQFPKYDRYDAATFSEAHKAEVRDTQFPVDLEKAYELGKRLVGKCTEV